MLSSSACAGAAVQQRRCACSADARKIPRSTMMSAHAPIPTRGGNSFRPTVRCCWFYAIMMPRTSFVHADVFDDYLLFAKAFIRC
jgi:hypothetical protein